MWRWGVLMICGLIIAGCTVENTEQEPVRQPVKDSTWVKKETVELTKEEHFEQERQSQEPVPVDNALKGKLLDADATPTGKVTDKDTCLAEASVIDKRRMKLQRSGGMWHAFERSPEARPWSNNGMQIDSNFNKLIHALLHLCKTADGLPMTDLAQRISHMLEEKGEEGTLKILKGQGRAKKDNEIWIEYAKKSQKAATRKVPYATTESLILKMHPLMDLMEDLYQRKVDASNSQKFVSDSVTLLAVINHYLGENEHFVLALSEDFEEPFYKFEGEM